MVQYRSSVHGADDDTVELEALWREAPSPDEQERATLTHRMSVLVLVPVITGMFYLIQRLVWPHPSAPHSIVGWTWSWLGVLWALAFIPAVFELAGLLSWRAPRAHPRFAASLVCWRVVSRGINTEALRDTIAGIRDEMRETPLFPYIIEVVMDTRPPGPELPCEDKDLRYIVVPQEYSTPGRSRNKARSLNYALYASPLHARAWIVHCDEETRPTPSGIIGIAAMIREEEARHGCPRIGQGTITYHRDWERHPFFTLSDCVRTGSDLGRLYLSMMIGVPLFGLHGSFIVVRNDVERTLGFDVGPIGSLTEDAWWGTIAMDKGYRCRWVEGHLAEQCTYRVPDFLKQRRRWFNGMGRTARSAPVRLRWRAILSVSMLAWASAPFAWAYTIGHLLDGGYISPWVRAAANISLAVYITTTLVGLRVNMEEHGIRSPLQKIRWALTWLVLMPVFSLLESLAVAFAIIRPARNFHVVQK